MGAERDATTAMNTNKRLTGYIHENSVNGAGLCTCSTAAAEVHLYYNPSAFSLRVSPGGTCLDTGGWVTGKAGPGLEP